MIDPEKRRAQRARYYQKHKDRINAETKLWGQNNPEKRKAIRDKWRNNNLDKARAIESASRKKHIIADKQRKAVYRQANKGLINFYTATRRSKKSYATPAWLDREQRQEMIQFYKEAKELQWLSLERLEVDHIVPLQGRNVSGLHVPWNLQILPKGLNVKKGNSHDSD
jgi:5-methylcytosine-specific restriction endonuclease McrA